MNLVALIQPRYVVVVSGVNDPRYDLAVREFRLVDSLYNHIGFPERAIFVQTRRGHETSLATVLPFLQVMS